MAHIVLIGPMKVGKSTTAPLVASLTGRERVDVDDVRFDHYRRNGYDDSLAGSLASSGDYVGLIAYWKPFEADLVEYLVATHHDAVLDLGAGHADYPPGPLLERVVAALSDHYVVLLLPSASHEKSAELLASRFTEEDGGDGLRELNRDFITSSSFRQLADTTIYVAGLTPEDVAAEVVARWRDAANS